MLPNYYNFSIDQGSIEWLAARLGKFTASNFHLFMGNSEARLRALCGKASERITGDSDREEFSTWGERRGSMLEPEARRMYQAINDVDVVEVGIVEDRNEFDGWVASSPDGLIGEDGILEVKSFMDESFALIKVKKDKGQVWISPEIRTQIQYNLFVTQRKWCDLFYYHPRLGYIQERIPRDEDYILKIQEALRTAIQEVKNIQEIILNKRS